MNNQLPLPPDQQDGHKLLVHSIFYSVQGEGPYSGHPAVFIRLSGCTIQCPMCDTEYTQDAVEMGLRSILAKVKEFQKDQSYRTKLRPLVVLTGGEPFRQAIGPLVDILHTHGNRIQIETNGTAYQSLAWSKVKVICSPKTEYIHPRLLPHVAAYKYVLQAPHLGSDGLPTVCMGKKVEVAKPSKDFQGPIYVMPLDEKDEERNQINTLVCLSSALRFGYILGLQIHKTLGVE